jgi:hypothetical protein
MFGSLSASLIALRQKSLDAYLQSILVRPELTMTDEVRDFVGKHSLFGSEKGTQFVHTSTQTPPKRLRSF